jgi:hypothetical protein
MGAERADGGFAEQRTQREAHRGAVPQFGAGGADRMRQAHAAMRGRSGDAGPAARRPGPIGVAKARRRGDMTVLVARAMEVADAVERGDHVGGEAPGLLDHRGGGRRVELAKQPFRDRRVETGDMGQGELDVGDGRAIGQSGLPRRVGSVSPVSRPLTRQLGPT